MSAPIQSPAALLAEFVAESWADFRRIEDRAGRYPYAARAGGPGGFRRPLAFTRAMLDAARFRCRDLLDGSEWYDGNCFAVGAARSRRNYVVGASGFKVGAGPAPGQTPADADLADVDAFLAAFGELNDLPALERQSLFRLDADGNALLRLFPATNGIPEVRWVEMDRLRAPGTAPAGPPQSAYVPDPRQWGIDTDPDDRRKVLGYWVERYPGDPDPEYVPEAEVVHLMDDDDGALVMGWPAFEPAIDPLCQAEELLLAGTARVKVQAKYAVIEKVPGFTQTAADDYRRKLTGGDTPAQQRWPHGWEPADRMPYGAKAVTGNEIVPGTIGGGAADVEMMKLARLTEAATALNMPRWMFSGEPDEKYANAFAALGPALQGFLHLQALLSGGLVTRAVGRRASLCWRAVRMGVAAGLLRPDVLRTVRPTCTPPNLESRDRAGDVAADHTLYADGAMSLPTYQEKNNLDPKREASRGAKPQPDLQPARAGGANPAGPGVSPTAGA